MTISIRCCAMAGAEIVVAAAAALAPAAPLSNFLRFMGFSR
jgi:hypothetical protein